VRKRDQRKRDRVVHFVPRREAEDVQGRMTFNQRAP
jgi:hypothetical protein